MILNRDTFLDAVTFASKAITGRSQTPILECLRLVARDGRLTVTGSNMEMTVSRSLAAEGELEACVSANRLGMFLKTCPADEIEVKLSGSDLWLSTQTQESLRKRIETLPVAEFYEGASVNEGGFPIPGDGISRVLPAVSDDPNRMDLAGVLIEKDALVCTTGKTIHVVTGEFSDNGAVTIPTAAATILTGCEGMLATNGKAFTAKGGDWQISGKVIEVPFVKWRSVLFRHARSLPVPEGMTAAISRAVNNAHYTSTDIPRVIFGDGRLETKEYSEALDLDMGFRIGLPPRMILNAIRHAREGARIEFKDTGSTINIVSDNYIAAMLPIRV